MGRRRIYTTGYANWTLEGLLQAAKDLNAVIIDIRLEAASSRTEWNYANLARVCRSHYYHVPALGNLNYKGGPIEIADFSRGVRVLTEFSQDLILMCGCRDLGTCHRFVVAERLRSLGIESEELMRTMNPSVRDGEIPVLSLWQPWAQFVVLSEENGRHEKAFETRHWITTYRGPVAVYATLKWDREIKDYCLSEPFRSVLSGHLGIPSGYADDEFLKAVRSGLPFGRIVGTARIADVVPSEAADGPIAEFGGRYERAFGNYGPGRAGFLLTDVVRFAEPVTIKGQQGWFNVPVSVLDGTASHIAPVTVPTTDMAPITDSNGPGHAVQMDLFG